MREDRHGAHDNRSGSDVHFSFLARCELNRDEGYGLAHYIVRDRPVHDGVSAGSALRRC